MDMNHLRLGSKVYPEPKYQLFSSVEFMRCHCYLNSSLLISSPMVLKFSSSGLKPTLDFMLGMLMWQRFHVVSDVLLAIR